MNQVIIVGSINIDMVMVTNRLPEIGETILGKDMNYFMGGKGANQAVASSRMSVPVKIVGSVGDDNFGEKALNNLEKEKIDTSLVSVEKNIFTGLASIFSINTDNSIVVLPGANMLVDIDENFKDQLSKGDVVLAQLEIPLSSVRKSFKEARKRKAKTILNPAPYHKDFLDFIDLIDIITPNETEFSSMINKKVNKKNIEEEMLKWTRRYSTNLIVTRGSEGVSYVKDNEVHTISGHNVKVKDSTGAGDTFNGILASLLVRDFSLDDAINYANYGAAISTLKIGAQSGMPTYEELFQ